MNDSSGERNYISVKTWMVMMIVSAIPVIGQLMVLVWAFTGENDSRKNYFRAILAWMVIVLTVAAAVVVTGMVAPGALKQIPVPSWLHKS